MAGLAARVAASVRLVVKAEIVESAAAVRVAGAVENARVASE
jgi:hypothetical protein